MVLMFHSVGCEKENWYRNWLSVSLNHFETFCKFLVKENYETILLEEWYRNSSNKKNGREKKVVLTFDDGYLDNWVYVYPILKKYNLKGTIFVNPEFIEDSQVVRSNLIDVWEGKIEKSQLAPLGFVNWSELNEMDSSGVLDVQSHSMSHNFYYHSNILKDIYNGQANYDWLAWIKKPHRKPYYITENQKGFIPFGTPIFEFGRALGLRRYFPDDEFVNQAIRLYETDKNNKTELLGKLNRILQDYPGKFESDEDMEKRYRYELFESKKILENKLNKSVDFLCWPGGGYNELSVNLSIEAGYKASTGTPRHNLTELNKNKDYKRIKRFPMGSFITTSKSHHYVNRPNYLVNMFKSHEGSALHKTMYYAHKLGLMILEKIRK